MAAPRSDGGAVGGERIGWWLMGITNGELKRCLHIGKVDPDELLELLSHLVGECQSLDERRLIFPSPRSGPARIILGFNAGGRVTDATVGEALTEEDLAEIEAQIRRQLLAPTQPRVVRKILYSTQPVRGRWHFKNTLVLRSLPEGNPEVPWLSDTHPLIFECVYPGVGDVDSPVNYSRGERFAGTWMSILALVAAHLVLPEPGPARMMWATSVMGRSAPSSQWVRAGYEPNVWDEQGTLGEIAVTDEHTGVARCESPLHLPTYLAPCLQAFDSLGATDRRSLLHAAHWVRHAAQAGQSPSAAYTAVVQSVEVLVKGHEGESSSKAFRDFIDRYAPATDKAMAKRHRDLYRIRSLISHGERLFVSDRDILGMMMPNPQRWHEELLLAHATAVCRTAIINWLLAAGAQTQAAG
ncbi:hypothetical protein [Streptomyces sp. NBC_01669]|uniref:hypothetical protein n=1 Tax=Streptomyces sp. NBC_01669 TaxID=2975909 RepID=UPI00225720CE|nr:hypothetical protein [Streptomyces sp. NBC_01669]MCX4531016.1 hypothetical protein [Streptomyces sp. NBC_01669]